jgi:hypothetical protein
VRFYRGSTPYLFTGQWSGDLSRQVNLQLNRHDNVAVQAGGTVTLRGRGDVARIQIDGQEQGRRLRVAFRTEGSAGDGGAFDYIEESDKARGRQP